MENAQDDDNDDDRSSIGTTNPGLSDDDDAAGSKKQSEADAGFLREKRNQRHLSRHSNSKEGAHSSEEDSRAFRQLKRSRELNRQSKIRCRKRKKEIAACLQVQVRRLTEENNSLCAENRDLRKEWNQCILERNTAERLDLQVASSQMHNISNNAQQQQQQQQIVTGPGTAFASQQTLLSNLYSPRSSHLDALSATPRAPQQDNHHLHREPNLTSRMLPNSLLGVDFDARRWSPPVSAYLNATYSVPITLPPPILGDFSSLQFQIPNDIHQGGTPQMINTAPPSNAPIGILAMLLDLTQRQTQGRPLPISSSVDEHIGSLKPMPSEQRPPQN